MNANGLKKQVDTCRCPLIFYQKYFFAHFLLYICFIQQLQKNKFNREYSKKIRQRILTSPFYISDYTSKRLQIWGTWIPKEIIQNA